TYQIAAGDEYEYSYEYFRLSLTAAEAPEAPANDDFADRIILTGTNVSVMGSTLGATREGDEPNTTPWNSVWWSWTAPIAGVCVLDTMGFDSVPALGVYVGSTLTALTPVANLIWNTSGDPYAFAITAGTTYQIAVGGAEHGFELFLG